ncbi:MULTISPECIES: hypothetical protein [unclassified Acinetobacter]|uniref:hypothetical protein n=1 Tax=unclassified Acinetobacter TaxID=196816 RepID=UPI0035B82518
MNKYLISTMLILLGICGSSYSFAQTDPSENLAEQVSNRCMIQASIDMKAYNQRESGQSLEQAQKTLFEQFSQLDSAHSAMDLQQYIQETVADIYRSQLPTKMDDKQIIERIFQPHFEQCLREHEIDRCLAQSLIDSKAYALRQSGQSFAQAEKALMEEFSELDKVDSAKNIQPYIQQSVAKTYQAKQLTHMNEKQLSQQIFTPHFKQCLQDNGLNPNDYEAFIKFLNDPY